MSSPPESIIFEALKELYPDAQIRREVRIDEEIWHDGQRIRKYIVADFWITFPTFEVIIEFNGAHHYRPVLFSPWDSLERAVVRLEAQQVRDRWLKHYCQANNINFINFRKYRNKVDMSRKLKERIDGLLEPTS